MSGTVEIVLFPAIFPVLLHTAGDFKAARCIHGTASAPGHLRMGWDCTGQLQLLQGGDDGLQFVALLTQVVNDFYQIQTPDSFALSLGTHKKGVPDSFTGQG
jgi:hypothetical protein